MGASSGAMTQAMPRAAGGGGKGGAQGVQQAPQGGLMGQMATQGMNAFQQAPKSSFAGMNPYQQASTAQASAMGGMQQAMNYTPERVAAERIAGVDPITEERIKAAQLAGTDMSSYMNPYTEQVIKANEADILRGAEMGINTLDTAASKAGAFGGSRHGVALGEYGRNVAQQLAQSSAGLRQAEFTQAQAAAQQDLARQMQAQQLNQAANLQAQTQTGQFGMQKQLANQQTGLQAGMANQQAGLTANQQRIAAAQGLGGLGQQSFGYGQSIQGNLAQQGQQQQVINQALIDAAKGQYTGYQQSPISGLGIMTQALGASPHGQTQTRQLGLMDYLTAGATIAGAMPSDVRLKTNIKVTGKLESGLNTYSWDWNAEGQKLTGDKSSSGVIAQEVAEMFPEAVITGDHGYMMVDYSHPELRGVI